MNLKRFLETAKSFNALMIKQYVKIRKLSSKNMSNVNRNINPCIFQRVSHAGKSGCRKLAATYIKALHIILKR